jgi:hypothetical protein
VSDNVQQQTHNTKCRSVPKFPRMFFLARNNGISPGPPPACPPQPGPPGADMPVADLAGADQAGADMPGADLAIYLAEQLKFVAFIAQLNKCSI